jgi:hypothetical protein
MENVLSPWKEELDTLVTVSGLCIPDSVCVHSCAKGCTSTCGQEVEF